MEAAMKLLWPEGAPHAQGNTDEDKPAITAYVLPGKHHPAVVICPGGGYGHLAAHEGEPVARWLNGLGISAFVLRYRIAPYRYPCAWLDAQRAIRTVRAEADAYGIDPARVGILGFSAGGHLASTVGTANDQGDASSADPIERESSRPDIQILCYPVITLLAPYGHSGSRNNLLGPDHEQAMADLLSNENQISSDTPPTFLWHTSDDASVPVQNSLFFANALHQNGVPFDLHVYAKGRHGLGLATDMPHVRGWTDACATWLKEQGF